MRESGQDAWWRRSGQLAGATIAAIVALALLPWLFAAALGERTFLGLPLPYFLFALALPLAILAAIFWFARRQDVLDHRYDVTGTQA